MHTHMHAVWYDRAYVCITCVCAHRRHKHLKSRMHSRATYSQITHSKCTCAQLSQHTLTEGVWVHVCMCVYMHTYIISPTLSHHTITRGARVHSLAHASNPYAYTSSHAQDLSTARSPSLQHQSQKGKSDMACSGPVRGVPKGDKFFDRSVKTAAGSSGSWGGSARWQCDRAHAIARAHRRRREGGREAPANVGDVHTHIRHLQACTG
jgi:hypothetical protein